MLALMASENRAAAALGRTYPGGMPAFVTAMNAKAETLGIFAASRTNSTARRPPA
jgi:serine-type D-Ala-D-Ala endopeptidase (penicillin-binding protein 7)